MICRALRVACRFLVLSLLHGGLARLRTEAEREDPRAANSRLRAELDAVGRPDHDLTPDESAALRNVLRSWDPIGTPQAGLAMSALRKLIQRAGMEVPR